jgi:hypothetical protein
MQDDDYLKANDWFRYQDRLGEYAGHHVPDTRQDYTDDELVRLFTRASPESRTQELQRLSAFTRQEFIPSSDLRGQSRLHKLQRRMMRRHAVLLKNGR